MRIGMHLNYAGGFTETVTELADYEKAGLDIVFVPEAYSYDAVSQLGFIAAKTERLEIGSGIFQLYSRTPALTAKCANPFLKGRISPSRGPKSPSGNSATAPPRSRHRLTCRKSSVARPCARPTGMMPPVARTSAHSNRRLIIPVGSARK